MLPEHKILQVSTADKIREVHGNKCKTSTRNLQYNAAAITNVSLDVSLAQQQKNNSVTAGLISESKHSEYTYLKSSKPRL